MVLCKFFQQGSCRFGQSCRYEHVYGSKYSYHSSAPPQAASSTPAVTDEQLVNQVHSDVQAVLQGGQWLLSSYAPFKEKAAFPGITDLSPEEARLFIYEAKASNNLEQAMAYMNSLFKEARTKHEQLLLKNSNIIGIFRSLYKGEPVSSPFGNATQEVSAFGSGNSAASSVFRSAVQTSPFTQTNQSPTPSIFNQNTALTVFGQSNATPSIFAPNANQDPAKSIFAQASQNSFNTHQPAAFAVHQSPNSNIPNSQNVFGPQTDNAKSIFAQATQNSFTSVPQNTQTPASIFANASQSIFSQQNAMVPQNQKPETQNVFGTQNIFQQAQTDMSFYGKMEDLSAEDLDAYNSDDFKIGFVPEVPPPHSLCF